MCQRRSIFCSHDEHAPETLGINPSRSHGELHADLDIVSLTDIV
jgi:hypothetical protein